MATTKHSMATNSEVEEARRRIKTSGNASVARAYFRETHASVENAELDSKGLYSFEKLVREAFVESMQEDSVLGCQDGFVRYISTLSESFEGPVIRDWRPEASAERIGSFMLSFFDLYCYQWKLHGRPAERSLARFMEIMHECLDFGYLTLSGKFNSLPKEIKATINKTFFLTNGKIDDWHKKQPVEV